MATRQVKIERKPSATGTFAGSGGGAASEDPFGDAHGIDFDTYTYLLDPGAADGEVSVDGGADQDFETWLSGTSANDIIKFSNATFRRLSGVPKKGQTFLGHEDGDTDATGCTDLGTSGWTQDGTQFYKDATFTAQGQDTNALMADGTNQIGAETNERDAWAEDLWVDDTRWRHLATKASVDASGEFHIEYDTPSSGTHRVWIGVDPTGLSTIELAVEPWFLVGGSGDASKVDDVKLRNMTIRRYATLDETGCVGGGRAISAANAAAPTWNNRACEGWDLKYVTVRQCHAGNVHAEGGWTIDRCLISEAGQIGLSTNGNPGAVTYTDHSCTVTNTHFTLNCQLTFDWGNSGGGTKFKGHTDGLTVTNCLFDHNDGAGFWTDFPEGPITLTQIKAERNVGWNLRVEVMQNVTSGQTSVVEAEINHAGRPTDMSDDNPDSNGIGWHGLKVVNGHYLTLRVWGTGNRKGVQLQSVGNRGDNKSIDVVTDGCDLKPQSTSDLLFTDVAAGGVTLANHDVAFADDIVHVDAAGTDHYFTEGGNAYSTTPDLNSTEWGNLARVSGLTVDTAGGTPAAPDGVDVYVETQYGPFAVAA